MSVILAVLMTLTGPTAFAEDPPADPTTEAPAAESPSPEPSPSADPSPAPSPEPSPESSPEPTTAPDPSPEPTTAPAPSPEPSPTSVLPVGTPTISSDKGDYPPGGAVILTGTNWQPGEIVHIRVNDDAGESWRRDVDVIAGGNGTIRDEFQLPDWFVAVYTVTAIAPVSGTATTTFTDGNVTVRARVAVGSPISVEFPIGSVQRFDTNTTCSGTASASNTASFTTPTPGNGFQSSGLIANAGSVRVQAPSPVTVSGTTYNFSSWSADNGATRQTSASTNPGCFNSLSNSTVQLTANYTANAAPVATIPSFSPASPQTSDSLQASTTTSDTDGDNISVAWTWKITRGANTCRVSTASSAAAVAGTRSVSLDLSQSYATSLCTGASPPANINPSKGDTVIVEATPNDGTVNGTLRTNSVAIANAAPVASAQSVSTDEDVAKTITLTGADNDGDPLSFRVTTLPANGSLYVGIGTADHKILTSELPYALPSSVVTFDPDANFDGSDSFDFKAYDGTVDSAAATVSIDVTPVNDAPVLDLNGAAAGVDTSATFDEDDPPVQLAPNLTITDVDSANMGGAAANLWGPGMTAPPDGASESLDWDATACVGVLPSYNSTTGVLTITGTAARAVYEGCLASVTYENTSQDPSTVARTVQFVVFDAGSFAASNRPDVAITVAPVNDAPVAVDDENSTDEDTDVDTDVIANDTDVDNTNTDLTVDASSISATNGTAVLLAGGRTIRFTPDPDLNDDTVDAAGFTVTYQATDGALNSNQATLTISVAPVNDAPVANDDTGTTDEDTALVVAAPGVLGNDTDVEDDPLAVAEVNGETADVGTPITLTSGALLTLNADGSYSYDPNGQFESLDDGESDTDSFTYRADDGDLDSNEATVTITITGVNDAPVANDDTGTTDEDTALVVAAPGVLGNDTDVEDDPLAVAEVNGETADVGTPITLTSGALLTLNADGSYSYDPNGQFESLDDGESDTDSFTYRADDGDLDSNEATVTITITGVNDAPVANDDTGTTDEDTALVVAAPGVLGNDTDVDVETLSVFEVDGVVALVGTEITLGSGAKVTLNANGSFTYKPDGAFESLDSGESTTDSFTYKASDGTAESNQATVTITITGVNDAPVISSASFGGSVSCPTAPGVTNATLSVSFTDIDDENPAFTATIDWDITTAGPDEGPFPVSEGSFGRGHSYATVGTYTARVTVSDGTTTDSETAVITVNYNTSGILQPVNWTQAHNDPSIFKFGSTLPVKVRFFDCDGTNAGSGLSVKVEVRKIVGTTPGTGIDEAITNTNSPDSGGFMRSSGDLYLYNLNTGSLSDKTATYQITLTVQSTGQTVTTLFGTKAK